MTAKDRKISDRPSKGIFFLKRVPFRVVLLPLVLINIISDMPPKQNMISLVMMWWDCFPTLLNLYQTKWWFFITRFNCQVTWRANQQKTKTKSFLITNFQTPQNKTKKYISFLKRQKWCFLQLSMVNQLRFQTEHLEVYLQVVECFQVAECLLE